MNDKIKFQISELSESKKVAGVLLSLALVAVFLPWARILVFSVSGTDTDYGIAAIFSSLLALVFLTLELPRFRNKSRQSDLALAFSLGSAAIYLYCAIQLGSVTDLGSGDLLSDSFSIGIGLTLGLVSSLLAASLLTLHRLNRPQLTDIRLQIAIGIAISALAGLLIPQLGVLTLVEGLAIAGLIYSVIEATSRRIVVCMFAIATISIAGGTTRLVIGNSSTTSDASGLFGDSSKLQKCEDLMKEGADVKKIKETDTCKDKDGSSTFLFTSSDSCKNGKTLVYNDEGWGYLDGTWTRIGEPPTGRCNSTATEQCTSIFAAGVTTQSSWTSMDECLDGNDVKWVYTSTMPCFSDDREYIYNEFGWGFPGQPWTLGDKTPTC